MLRPPTSTLFPYTTLFRSHIRTLGRRCAARSGVPGERLLLCHRARRDRKSTRLNSSHQIISYAVFCLKKKSASGAPTAEVEAGAIEQAEGTSAGVGTACAW